jgi:competence protein ComEC
MFLVVTAILLGFIYTWLRLPHPPATEFGEFDAKQRILVSGRIQATKWRFTNGLYLFARDVRVEESGRAQAVPGTLLISVDQASTPPVIGQRFQGRIRLRPVHSLKNPGCWNGESYWGRQGVWWRTYIKDLSCLQFTPESPGFFHSLRQALRLRVMDVLPEGKGRALTLALLLGERSELDHEVYDLMQRAGIVHSLALSGLHLGFMAFFGWGLARGVGWLFPGLFLVIPRPKLAVLFGIPLVGFYMWLGGWTPSLLRAGIMFGSWGMLLLMNRTRVLIDGLCLAVLLILLWSPAEIFSLSLQFSVLAVAGIVLAAPSIQAILASWAKESPVRKPVAYVLMVMVVSVIATLAVLPVQAWTFGTVTMHQYYNIFWIPLLGFILLPLGFLGLLVSFLPGGQWPGSLFLLLVDGVMGRCCDLLALARDQGWLEMVQVMRPGWPELLGFYTLVGICLLAWKRAFALRRVCLLVFGCTLSLLVLPGMAAHVVRTTQVCRVLVMDTGMSQAVYVELPGNRRVLVDGGGSWDRDFDMGRAVVSPVLTWKRPPRLDAVFLTHSDCDHLRGLLHPLANCLVGGFYWNGRPPKNSWDRESLEKVLLTNRIPVHQIRAGRHIDLGEGVRIEVLHPQGDATVMSRNDGSLVLRFLVHGRGLLLVPGDIEEKGIASLLATDADLQAELLILPHHGSASSWSEALYDRVDPRVAVAAAGWKNRYGFPHKKVVASLKRRGVAVASTGEEGAIEVVWPKRGSSMAIHSMRSASFNLP